ncbi:hypothetical protein C8Q80DRAFT_1109813 [Daedaleopsis nitida]|nr:hypothetical protein C8Q80DRAFT_1109813 [Daedaleopsis nitida]
MLLPKFATHCRPSGADRFAWVKTRYTCFAAAFVVIVTFFHFYGRRYAEPNPAHVNPQERLPTPAVLLPPLYSEFHDAELRLSHQDWSKTRPSENERFLFVASHVASGQGWGNALQEHLLNAYLAYHSGRTFVMYNFTWNGDGSLYSKYNDKDIPSQIPFSALIRGPIAGEPFPNGDRTPPATSEIYYDHICPTKHEVNRYEVIERLSAEDQNSASVVTATFSRLLRDLEHPCVEISRSSGAIYGHSQTFGVRGALEKLWPDFAASPIVTHFGWSTLIELAFDINHDLFMPKDPLAPFLSTAPFTTNAERYTVIPGLMVIHVRRGDYEGHCRSLAHWAEDFVSVDTFPDLPDQFTTPPRKDLPNTTAGNIEYYRKRCYPTVQEIVRKVTDVLRTPAARGVRRIHIMTNGRPPFIGQLKGALRREFEWESVTSSRDLVLNWEQKYVAQAVDQLVGQRAQIFIGNGFSTLTSTTVTMRVANRLPADSTRFW